MLNDILKKLGLKYEQLTPEERETYKNMEVTLKEDMTIDNIKEFLDGELERLQTEIASNETKADFILKAQMRNYTALKYYIESPKLAKDKLEAYLEHLKLSLNK